MTNEPESVHGETVAASRAQEVAPLIPESSEEQDEVPQRADFRTEQFTATKSQARNLESLLTSQEVRTSIQRLEDYSPSHEFVLEGFNEKLDLFTTAIIETDDVSEDKQRDFKKGSYRAERYEIRIEHAMQDVYAILTSPLDKQPYDNTVARLETLRDSLQGTIRELRKDTRIKRLESVLDFFIENNADEDGIKITEEIRWITAFTDGEITAAYLALKLQRLEALMKIDPKLARKYLAANRQEVEDIGKFLFAENRSKEKKGPVYAFWQKDDNSYFDAISGLKIVDDPPAPVKVKEEKPRPVVIETPRPIVKGPEPVTVDSMRTALFGSLNMNGRRRSYDLFVDYAIVNSGLTQERLRSLQKIGAGFAYSSWMRRRPLTPVQEDYFWNKLALLIEERKSDPVTDLVSKRDFRKNYKASSAYKPKSA